MADWKEQYLAALRARDEVEKANLELFDSYTRIADQKAELEKKSASNASVGEETAGPVSPPPPLVGMGLRRVASPQARPDSPSLVQMRQDLARAQQERADLQSALDVATRELETLKAKSKLDSRRMTQLSASVSQMSTKLRDRDEELKGKTKLLDDVQDENVTLNLQLNMAEEQRNELKKENQDLVDRWMARMGKEADQMNERSKFR